MNGDTYDVYEPASDANFEAYARALYGAEVAFVTAPYSLACLEAVQSTLTTHRPASVDGVVLSGVGLQGDSLVVIIMSTADCGAQTTTLQGDLAADYPGIPFAILGCGVGEIQPKT